MRNILYLLVSLCLLSFPTFSQTKSFYDHVLAFERCRNCYFVVVNVESNVYKGPLIVEADDLLGFLTSGNQMDRMRSKTFLRDLLTNKGTLQVANGSLGSHGFYLNSKHIGNDTFRIVKDFEEIDPIASKGCIGFIQYYFLPDSLTGPATPVKQTCREFIMAQTEPLFLKRKILGIREQNAIIQKLFEWQIPTRIDGVSGLLTIDRDLSYE